MNRVKRIVAIIFGLAALAVASRGQDIGLGINPALHYYRAFILETELNQADHDLLWTNEWRGQQMPDYLGEVLNTFHNSFDEMRLATHATNPCDWGVDVSSGPDTLLPHLARAKQLAVTDKLRIMWELQNGDQMGARDDALGIFTLARNASYDGTLIGVLVDFATENIVNTTVAENFYAFSPDTLQQIVDGFDAAPPARTVSSAILTGERNLLVTWLGRKLADLQKQYPNDDATILAKLQSYEPDMDGASSNLWKEAFSAGNNLASFQKMLADCDAAFQKASEILALPYAEFLPQGKQFDADTQKSGNALLAISMPAIMRAKTKEFRQQIVSAMIRAAVAYKNHGNAAFLSIADPGGSGAFQTSRFMFNGVDRGFKLTSAFSWEGHPETMIFVETPGTPFVCYGIHAGDALSK